MKELIKRVCNVHGITLKDLRKRDKHKSLMKIRGSLYAYLKYETDHSTTDIGKELNRCHSTVVTVGNDYYYQYQRFGYFKDEIDGIRSLDKITDKRTD